MATGILDPRVEAQINMVQPVNLLHPLSRGLVVWGLPLPGTTGGARFMDVASPGPNGNHGTLMDMDPATDWIAGEDQVGPGVDLDGVVAYLDFGQASRFILGQSSWTASVVYKVTGALSNNDGLISADATGPFPFAVKWDDTFVDWKFVIDTASPEEFHSGHDPVIGAVELVTVSLNSAGRQFYVNGVLAVSDDQTAAPTDTGDDLLVGADFTPASDRKGPMRIYAVQIHNRGLSASEVLLHYQLGQRGYPGLLNRIASGPIIPPALVGGALPPYGQVIFNSADQENRPRYGQRIARGTVE